MTTPRFADRLAAALDASGSPVCVGLDPVADRMPPELADLARRSPAEACRAFCEGVIDACRGPAGGASAGPSAAVVKVQSACFERYGSAGFAAMERVFAHARAAGLLTVWDAKRGDIGISAAHYAAAARALGADAITISPYVGPCAFEPMLESGLGVFILVRTTNPDADALQALELAQGGTLAEQAADLVAEFAANAMGERGLSDVGAVVGATRPEAGAALRTLMPDSVLLVPGVGAQGGEVASLAGFVRPGATSAGTAGLLVTASRGVIHAFVNPRPGATPGPWTTHVRDAAARLADECRALLPGA